MSQDTILLVEDTPSLAYTYLEYLDIANYKTFHAANGTEALELVARKTIAAVVLDVVLPDINGLDVLRHMHTQYPGMPVVVITAHGSSKIAAEAIKAGAYDYITKPFSAQRLQVTLRNALIKRSLDGKIRKLEEATKTARRTTAR